jgi:hypothetical protein
VPEIVKEPAVQFSVAQRTLNFSYPFCRSLFCVHRSYKDEAKNKCCEGRKFARCHQASKLLNETRHVPGQFLKALIVPERIEHRIEPE